MGRAHHVSFRRYCHQKEVLSTVQNVLGGVEEEREGCEVEVGVADGGVVTQHHT